MKRDESALLVVLAATFILVLYFGFESRITIYLIFVSIVITSYLILMASGFMKLKIVRKKRGSLRPLTKREKEFVVIHMLNFIEDRKSAEISALASDMGLEREELVSMLKVLEMEGAISFMYPAMQTQPIVVVHDLPSLHQARVNLRVSLAAGDGMSHTEFQKMVSSEVAKIKASRGSG